jgi:hypothetical protein
MPLIIFFIPIFFISNILVFKIGKNKQNLIIHNISYIICFMALYLLLQDWIKAEEIDFNASTFKLLGNWFVNILVILSIICWIYPFIDFLIKKYWKN